MQTLKIPLDLIKIGDRQRQDMGDIDDLANSLDRYGIIQPVVLDDDNNLIAGGRRCAAARLLGWTDIKACYVGTLTDDEREELELEENVRRKDMSWQERVLAIARIHAKKELNGALTGTKWGYRETGELLGLQLSNVSYALAAAKGLRDKDVQTLACGSLLDFVKLQLQRKEDEALASMAQEPSFVRPPTEELDETSRELMQQESAIVNLQCYPANALDFLDTCIRASIYVDHIITDPPYAIDMDNIQQENQGLNVERTAAEHEELANIVLLKTFLYKSFLITRETGFCVLWCDQDVWNFLKNNAEDAGWRVQRWPLVWVKTDPCQNMAAQYNFTKKTEIAMVLRKPGAVLNQHCPSNYWVGPGEDKSVFNHPFAKPLDLHRWAINAVSQPGQTILDPFAGSGTCPVACIQSGRTPIAVELKDIHYNECLENMKKAYRMLHGETVRFE